MRGLTGFENLVWCCFFERICRLATVCAICLFALTACNSGGSASADGTVEDLSNIAGFRSEITEAERQAARFLTQATFGPTLDTIAEVQRMGFEDWIDWQLDLIGPPHLDYVTRHSNGASRNARHAVWWKDVVEGQDQLRQRVAFALSQLFVVSDVGSTLVTSQYAVTNYYDLLREHAFGNYRELLEQVTLSPVMGLYLNMLQNDRSRPELNTRADENFAREVMQLFTIGLYNLNPDGTRATGNTYSQEDVKEFARVFTGWNFKGASEWNLAASPKADMLGSMEPFESHHDSGEKRLLNGALLPAGQSARQDLEMALDNLYSHPNVAPFVSAHLIKQLVTSNPSSAYVERVAAVFNNNGAGVKGDLGATVKAVLMDDEARNPPAGVHFGKLREPVLRLAHLWRAFSIQPGTDNTHGEYSTASPGLEDLETVTGQAPLRSPSVFNFFSPSYSAPGPARDAGLVVPEMQIFTDNSIISVNSRVNHHVFVYFLQSDVPSARALAVLDLSREIELASDPLALVDHLDLLLLSGSMKDDLRSILVGHLNDLEYQYDLKLERAQDAIALIMASQDYLVQK